jgi:hypothetical protein
MLATWSTFSVADITDSDSNEKDTPAIDLGRIQLHRIILDDEWK